MGEQHDPDFAVEYRPESTQPVVPQEVQDFLFGLPDVSGFRFDGEPSEKRIIVMIASQLRANNLPHQYKGYTLEPLVTGKFHAY